MPTYFCTLALVFRHKVMPNREPHIKNAQNTDGIECLVVPIYCVLILHPTPCVSLGLERSFKIPTHRSPNNCRSIIILQDVRRVQNRIQPMHSNPLSYPGAPTWCGTGCRISHKHPRTTSQRMPLDWVSHRRNGLWPHSTGCHRSTPPTPL